MSDTAINSQQQPLHSPDAETRLPSKEQEQQEYTNLINSLPTRWEIELEFVQSLSNIPYLSYLAQNNYLQDPCFVNYLKYLQYWNEPQYLRYLVYPNCLHILSLLQLEQFRRDIANPETMNVLMNDMVKRWQGDGDSSLADKIVTNGEELQNEKKGLSVEVVKGNNKRNGSEAVVGVIKEENEDTEQRGDEGDVKDKDVKDEDGDTKIE